MTFRFNHILITLHYKALLLPFVKIVISESLTLTMPSEKELRFVKHLSRRLQRKLNNATSTTKLIITVVGILILRGLNHEYILSFMLFRFFNYCFYSRFKNFPPYVLSNVMFNSILSSNRGWNRHSWYGGTCCSEMVIVVFRKVYHNVLRVFRKFPCSLCGWSWITSKCRYHSFWW